MRKKTPSPKEKEERLKDTRKGGEKKAWADKKTRYHGEYLDKLVDEPHNVEASSCDCNPQEGPTRVIRVQRQCPGDEVAGRARSDDRGRMGGTCGPFGRASRNVNQAKEARGHPRGQEVARTLDKVGDVQQNFSGQVGQLDRPFGRPLHARRVVRRCASIDRGCRRHVRPLCAGHISLFLAVCTVVEPGGACLRFGRRLRCRRARGADDWPTQKAELCHADQCALAVAIAISLVAFSPVLGWRFST